MKQKVYYCCACACARLCARVLVHAFGYFGVGGVRALVHTCVCCVSVCACVRVCVRACVRAFGVCACVVHN